MKIVHGTSRVAHVADHRHRDVLRLEQCGRRAHDVGVAAREGFVGRAHADVSRAAAVLLEIVIWRAS